MNGNDGEDELESPARKMVSTKDAAKGIKLRAMLQVKSGARNDGEVLARESGGLNENGASGVWNRERGGARV